MSPQEKERKREELKQLKKLKREEISARLQRLQGLTGNSSVGFSLSHLDGDFNPAQHDRMMAVRPVPPPRPPGRSASRPHVPKSILL